MHDRNGAALAHGDLVYLPARIVGTSAGPDFCNVVIESEHALYPSEQKTLVSLNALQIVKAPEPDVAIETSENAPTNDEGAEA